MPVPRCTALEKAMRILSVSAKSSRELEDKLLKSGFGPTEAESAVAECVRRGVFFTSHHNHFMNAAMTDADIKLTGEVAREAFRIIKEEEKG